MNLYRVILENEDGDVRRMDLRSESAEQAMADAEVEAHGGGLKWYAVDVKELA